GRPAALRALADAAPRDDAAAPRQLPIAPVAIEANRAQELARARALGRVLRPFMLRRTKEQVLAELPPKSEQVIGCRLEGIERRRYDELRAQSRKPLLPQAERDGVGKRSIVVLEALLRLRQACLHPGLLDATRAGD